MAARAVFTSLAIGASVVAAGDWASSSKCGATTTITKFVTVAPPTNVPITSGLPAVSAHPYGMAILLNVVGIATDVR